MHVSIMIVLSTGYLHFGHVDVLETRAGDIMDSLALYSSENIHPNVQGEKINLFNVNHKPLSSEGCLCCWENVAEL